MGDVLGIVGTLEFQDLLRRANRAPVPRCELGERFVPAGSNADDVWALLTSIRRSQAYFNPFVAYRDGVSHGEWYTVPESMHATLERLGSLTQHGSALDTMVGLYGNDTFVTQQYMDEILTDLRHDGFPAEHENIRAVIVGERTPVGTAEKVAVNFHHVMMRLGETAREAITAEVIASLHDDLLKGVDPGVCPLVKPGYPVENYISDLPGNARPPLDYLLMVEAALANGDLTEPSLHPILLSLIVNCFFWRYSPFPLFNNLAGCIVSRLFLYRAGYPAFRYVPKAWLYAKWRMGRVADLVPYSFDQVEGWAKADCDYTLLYDSLLRLILNSVESMERSLSVRNASDADAIAAISLIPYLNVRQVELLKRAVHDPEVEFRIGPHRAQYGVAYSTAREDLLQLADRGLLTLSHRGSAYVYRPVPQLKRLLAGGMH